MALTMEGRSAESIQTARDLMGAIQLEAIRAVPNMESFVPTPLFALARFGRWDEILREPPPPFDLHYTTALWHYARGLALAAKGRLDRAEDERREVERAVERMPRDRIVGNNSAKTILEIALQTLTGQLSARRGQTDSAIRQFQEAVRLQDQVRYYEPPDWYYPVRESLGFLLLSAGRAAEAETVFREDLRHTAENPWSLFGLTQSLRSRQADTEAAAVDARFRRAWGRADVEFTPSQFQAFLSKESPRRPVAQ